MDANEIKKRAEKIIEGWPLRPPLGEVFRKQIECAIADAVAAAYEDAAKVADEREHNEDKNWERARFSDKRLAYSTASDSCRAIAIDIRDRAHRVHEGG